MMIDLPFKPSKRPADHAVDLVARDGRSVDFGGDVGWRGTRRNHDDQSGVAGRAHESLVFRLGWQSGMSWSAFSPAAGALESGAAPERAGRMISRCG
jgi:hypothetical protein